MAEFKLDKLTVSLVIASLIILAYLGFMLIYPTTPVPEALEKVALIAVGFLFGGAPALLTRQVVVSFPITDYTHDVNMRIFKGSYEEECKGGLEVEPDDKAT